MIRNRSPREREQTPKTLQLKAFHPNREEPPYCPQGPPATDTSCLRVWQVCVGKMHPVSLQGCPLGVSFYASSV